MSGEQARTARTALSAKARNTGSLRHPRGVRRCHGLDAAVRAHDDVQLGAQPADALRRHRDVPAGRDLAADAGGEDRGVDLRHLRRAVLARAAENVAGALAVALFRRLDPLGRLLDAAQQRVEVAVGLLGRRRRWRLVGLGLRLGDLRRLVGLGLTGSAAFAGGGLGGSGFGGGGVASACFGGGGAGLGTSALGGGRRRRRWRFRRRLRNLGRRRWRRRRLGLGLRASPRPSGPAAAAPGSRPRAAAPARWRLAAPWAAGAKAWAGRSRSRSRPRSGSRPAAPRREQREQDDQGRKAQVEDGRGDEGATHAGPFPQPGPRRGPSPDRVMAAAPPPFAPGACSVSSATLAKPARLMVPTTAMTLP